MIKESNLKKGISAIIPTYKGEKYISKLLDSLINQSMDFNLFETIFIVNGELDSTPDIIRKYQENNPEVNIILTESEKGVCNARNQGIKIASREYCIFIDDDDYISNNYFEELFKHARPDRIVLGTFYDIDENSGNVINSYMTPQLLENPGIVENPYTNIKDAIVITTNKLIPMNNVKNSRFNPELTNGVDIGYYANFYPINEFEFYVVNKDVGANYYRLWRQGSISRQDLSYEFNITNRLKVINDINNGLKKAKTWEMKSFIESLTGGQIVIINKYLKKYPDDYVQVLNDIQSYDFDFFPYKYLNEDLSKLNNEERELIISYYSPYDNTIAGNFIAKKILSEKKNIDIICASLDDIRKDTDIEKLILEYIVNKFTVSSNFSTDWANILNFVNEGIKLINNYNTIHSMGDSIHSHFLAIKYKLIHPDTFWRAEFPDSLIHMLENKLFDEKIKDKEYVGKINTILRKKGLKLINNNMNIACICLYLTLILADEIIFTNKNQKDEILNISPFKVDIENKHTISSHPTLNKKYYHIKKTDYSLDENYINFAYFEDIYSNRLLEDFINAFDNIPCEYKDKVKFHLFTSNKSIFEQILSDELHEKTNFNPNISYLEFLNLSTKIDVLIVEDSFVNRFFIKNPYLPSQTSDYTCLKTTLWSICEENSEMSNLDIEYKSHVSNLNENINVLNSIINKKTNIPIQSSHFDEKEYFKRRKIFLNQKIHDLININDSELKKDESYEVRFDDLTHKIQIIKKENFKFNNANTNKSASNLVKFKKKFQSWLNK